MRRRILLNQASGLYCTVLYCTALCCYLCVRLVVFSRRQYGQNHSSCGCCSSTSLVGSMSTGRRAACSEEGEGEEEAAQEISNSASKWNTPQHRPHRMLWWGCSMNRPLNRQCRSLNVESSDPGPVIPFSSSATCCSSSSDFFILFDCSQSLNNHLIAVRRSRIE